MSLSYYTILMLTFLQRLILALCFVFGAQLLALELDSLLSRSPFIQDGYKTPVPLSDQNNNRARTPIEDRYEVRGVFTHQGKQLVSVWQKKEKRSMWVTVGEEMYPGFPVFSEYDPVERVFWVEDGGRREQLAMAESNYSKNVANAQSSPTFVSTPTALKASAEPDARRVVTSSNTAVRQVANTTSLRPSASPRTGNTEKRRNLIRSNSKTGPAQAPPPPPTFYAGRGLARAPQTPGLQVQTPKITGNTPSVTTPIGNNNSSIPSTNGNTQNTTNPNTKSPQVQRPVGDPPQNPTSQPPQNVPQLPPGFDLEQYLRDRASGG